MKLGIIVTGVLVIGVGIGLIIPLGRKTDGKQPESSHSNQPGTGVPASAQIGDSTAVPQTQLPNAPVATPSAQLLTGTGTVANQRVGNASTGSAAPASRTAEPASLPSSSGSNAGGVTMPQSTGSFPGGVLVNQQPASEGTTAAGGSGTNETNSIASPSPAGTRASQAGTVEIVQEVPTGASVPALFYDEEPRTPQQSAALDRIARDFNEAVSNPPPNVSETENWEAARRIADERYLNLFGYKAFNQHHLTAAKEAVKEKKAASASAQNPSSP